METTAFRSENIVVNIMVGAALGLITGFAGAMMVPLLPYYDLFYTISGGVCFGLGFGLWSKWRFGLGYLGVLLLICLTSAFYYAAVFTTIMARDIIKFGPELVILGAIGGSLGAFLVVVLTAIILPNARKLSAIAIVVIVGAIAGGAVLPGVIDLKPEYYSIMLLQMGWQAPVMAALFAVLVMGERR